LNKTKQKEGGVGPKSVVIELGWLY